MSREVREKAHRKLDDLLFSLSSGQLNRTDRDFRPQSPPSTALPPLSDAAVDEGDPLRRTRDSRTLGDSLDLPEVDVVEKLRGEMLRMGLRQQSSDPRARPHYKSETISKAPPSNISMAVDELIPYINSLLNYVHFLEKEREGFRSESDMRERTIRALTAEIESLRAELKRSLLDVVVEGGETEHEDRSLTEELGERLRAELEKSKKTLGLEKTKLEAKIATLETENADATRRIKDLRSQVETLEKSKEDVTAAARRGALVELTAEKDRLTKSVFELTEKLSEGKAREDDLIKELKKTVKMVDSTLLDKEESTLRENKLIAEVQRLQDDRERAIESMKLESKKIFDEKDAAFNSKKAELGKQIKVCEEEILRLRQRLEMSNSKLLKLVTYKESKSEESIEDICEDDRNPSKNVESILQELFSAKKELHELKVSKQLLETSLANEIKIYKEKSHRFSEELSESKTECLKLQEKVTNAEREACLNKMKRETVQKFHFEDLQEIQLQANQVEKKLQATILNIKSEYGKDLTGLRNFASQQSELMFLLKNECLALNQRLEELTEKLIFKEKNQMTIEKESYKVIEKQKIMVNRLNSKLKKLKKLNEEFKTEYDNLKALNQEQKNEILNLNETISKLMFVHHINQKEITYITEANVSLPST